MWVTRKAMVQADVHQEQHQPVEQLEIQRVQSNPFPPSRRKRETRQCHNSLPVHTALGNRQDPVFNGMPELNVPVCQAPRI